MNVTTTGLSEGDFHRLAVMHNGSMTDIVSLISSLGGGSENSATTPLSITGGVLAVDLSSYITSSAVNALLVNYRLTNSIASNFGTILYLVGFQVQGHFFLPFVFFWRYMIQQS